MALKDITLGQYFPGNSIVHRLDPRTKLIAVVLYIVALFLAKSFVTYGIMFLLLAVSIAVSKVPVKSIFRGMKPVVFIVIFTAILNLFYTPGDTVLVRFWIFTITLEGVFNAFFMVVRILMLIAGTFLLTYTTSPILLTDGLENLLGPLKKIHVPVHELAMMMSIALRFIPLLIEETDKIMSAQRARGADFESGNLIQRAKALVPLLVPLFISAFRRADELAIAMECRCYHGGEGRTRLRQLKYRRNDAAVILLFLVLTAGGGCWAASGCEPSLLQHQPGGQLPPQPQPEEVAGVELLGHIVVQLLLKFVIEVIPQPVRHLPGDLEIFPLRPDIIGDGITECI